MAELKEGEKNWEYSRVDRKDGFCYCDIAKYLRVDPSTVMRAIRALGIELGPMVRDEKFYKRVYTKRKRLLTRDEAKAIIALIRRRQGERIERGLPVVERKVDRDGDSGSDDGLSSLEPER